MTPLQRFLLQVWPDLSFLIIVPKSIVNVSGVVDSIAKELLPQGLDEVFPVLAVANCNCVPRSLSLHCFGDSKIPALRSDAKSLQG
ncbi:hypothetical protein PoB_002607400 [Plakobranchus ocellatus]|uniref:Uncharacterized protein n=1 Tax=Plakobranchus ocellatus TaxID=259542 RepID=A0AAV3ZW90_9GAST|nr:hypothetical protein PoB_002607400 [Plakobranchus ocellatus]